MSLILTMLREALDADRAAAGDTQRTLDLILERQNRMSKQLDDLTTQVQATTTLEASTLTLIQGLHDQLVAAGTDADKLEALKSDLATSAAQLAAAVTANTPAAAAPVATDPAAPVAAPAVPDQVATPVAADPAPADTSTSTTTTAA